jgi:TRAP-type C4-dicarboxylate transport system permease small subunit
VPLRGGLWPALSVHAREIGLKRAFATLAEIMVGIAAIGIAVAVVLNLAQIIYRYVLFSPLAWTEEAMRYVMIWVTMLGIAGSLYRGDEAMAGFFGGIRSARLHKALHLIRIALILAFGIMLAWFGLPFATGAGSQVSAAARIPMIWPNLAILSGGVLVIVMAVGMLVAPSPPREEDTVRPEDVA